MNASAKDPYIPQKPQLPVMALVNGVFAVLKRNPMLMVRAGFFPFVLLVILGLWETPDHWGKTGYYALRIVEWLLSVALWTFYANQLMRFVLKGPMQGAAQFLPRLDGRELRFGQASLIVALPISLFAFWYEQPLFFAQPDMVIMGAMTALDGLGELLYASLFIGWLMQLMAFVLPLLSVGDRRPLKDLFVLSFKMLRNDFTRLFWASLLVALPVWLFIGLIRLVLHMPVFTQLAIGDPAAAVAWNLTFFVLETLKVFWAGGMLAILWALAFGRMKGMTHDLG